MVLGKDGAAMSKSKGNMVDPEEMIGKIRRGHVPPVRAVRRAARKRHAVDRVERGRRDRFLERVCRFVTRNVDRTSAGDARSIRKPTGARCANCIRPSAR